MNPYFEGSAHSERKNLLMKEDLNELDDVSSYKITLTKRNDNSETYKHAKFGLVKFSETANIEASFHLHSCSAKEFFSKICQNSQGDTCTKVSFIVVTL